MTQTLEELTTIYSEQKLTNNYKDCFCLIHFKCLLSTNLIRTNKKLTLGHLPILCV